MEDEVQNTTSLKHVRGVSKGPATLVKSFVASPQAQKGHGAHTQGK